MSETLYRKYRPKNFSQVIGQAHIVKTLSNSIKNNRIGHAYLFTGPRGTGKTSIARILAKTINCENIKPARIATSASNASRSDAYWQSVAGGGTDPCDKCSSCKTINSGQSLDIVEIDAASNTGVDNIRELRETVALANAHLQYKVYIIDEVHMLSSGAFNALLKTLEEPPTHVVFILATTEIHKVPDTIISRCQRFDFARLPMANIIEKLTLIAKAEKVEIEKEALELIAISAEGGMRDAESILGQIISLEDKRITAKEAQEILGISGKMIAGDVARLIMEKNSTGAIAKINELLEEGYDLEVFNKSLVNYLRQLMLIKIDPELKKYFSFAMSQEQANKMLSLAKIYELSEILLALNLFLEAQCKISSFILPQLPLEIAIIKATHKFPDGAKNIEHETHIMEHKSLNLEQERQKTGNKTWNIEHETSSPEEKNNQTVKQLTHAKIEKINDSEGKNENIVCINLDVIKANWGKLLVDIRPYNHSLSALLSNCQPQKTENNTLVLATPYQFYQERLNENKNKLTLEEVFSKILGVNLRVDVVMDKSLAIRKIESDYEEAPRPERQQNPLLDSALEIMGGKIVD